MKANQAVYPVNVLCRALAVSPSGYYAWLKRSPLTHAQTDQRLRERIQAIHGRSRATYGRPRVHGELIDDGMRVSGKRIARLMKAAGLQGAIRRRGVRTTVRDADRRSARDRVERPFVADTPDRLWVADITDLPAGAGFLYLAVVLGVFSRRIVSGSMAEHLKTELVLDAFEMARQQRRPKNVIHHFDQGTQHTSIAFGLRGKEAGIRPSMGSVDDYYDNAMCESFFATLACEWLARRRFATKAEMRIAVFEFIEGWHNPHRRHSALGYRSPVNYEKQMEKAMKGAA